MKYTCIGKPNSPYPFSLLILPLALLLAVFLFLYFQNVQDASAYAGLQKKSFLYLNSKLSQFPVLENNLTQFGDALIFLSLLSFTILYLPKVWQSMISGLLVTLLMSSIFKPLFSVPRPAAMYDQSSFVIIGKTLMGHNSLPSGHSMTVFSILTVLLFMLMPKCFWKKTLWILFILGFGATVAASRIGVGAHYPIDVIVGSILGYICGVLGIIFNQKYRFWEWMHHKKFYPIFIVLVISCSVAVGQKIMKEPLFVFYIAFLGLLFSLYKITAVYVKKEY